MWKFAIWSIVLGGIGQKLIFKFLIFYHQNPFIISLTDVWKPKKVIAQSDYAPKVSICNTSFHSNDEFTMIPVKIGFF